MGGCLGRDRTQTFPIEFQPLKYQENFASKASFSCPETFRPSHILQTIVKKRLGSLFEDWMAPHAVYFAPIDIDGAVQTLINCNNTER
jgi:hypothetical protein